MLSIAFQARSRLFFDFLISNIFVALWVYSYKQHETVFWETPDLVIIFAFYFSLRIYQSKCKVLLFTEWTVRVKQKIIMIK